MREKPILAYVLHPLDQRNITIEDYLQDFGHLEAAMWPVPRCPLCGGDVRIKRMHDRGRTPYFAHAAGELAPCPLINSAVPDTRFITAHPANPVLEQQCRGKFIAHWQRHLSEIRRHVPHFGIQRYTQVIAHADILHLWACPTLRQEDIPYFLLVLSAFIAETPGAAHPTWLRFLFDASVCDLADLRKPNASPLRLYRLHYRASFSSMFPHARHLLDWREVVMNDAFLHGGTPHILMVEVFAFEAFLEQSARGNADDSLALALRGHDAR